MDRSLTYRTTIVSVGYEGRVVDDLVATLVAHDVEILVDVRLTPISRKKGFSKSALAGALDRVGIEYRHERELGNPKDNRDAFRKGDESARRRYEHHLANGANARYEATVERARSKRIALLCFERQHSECHRSSIANRALAGDPTFRILEL